MNIGIIGSGGAAMCAAWLLDQEHQVTMIEKKDYIGGHTHTVTVDIDGTTHYVDDGALLFSPVIYPYFNKYMDLTGIQYDWAPLSLTFFDSVRDEVNCLPPASLRSIVKVLTTTYVLPELLAFLKLLSKASPLVKGKVPGLSYKEFISTTGISIAMQEKFIKPLLSGLWGCPAHEVDRFSIYPLMNYMVYHKPSGLKHFRMKVMRGGTGKYIRTIADQLKNTNIRINDGALSVAPDPSGHKVTVNTATGDILTFDRLIITAGAHDAARICSDPAMTEARDALSAFEYYKTTLATHRDTSFMPPDRRDWSLVNVAYNGRISESTVWHGQHTDTDLFCSYIIDNKHTPKNIIHQSEWWLPTETPAFFEAQKTLAAMQGKDNIWFAGDYTRETGSHEDAIQSAVKAVQAISPESARLTLLKEGLPAV